MVAIFGVWAAFAGAARAANSNQSINIQGVLRDAGGNLQSMAVGLDISFYPSEMSATPYYTKHFATVPVDNGYFSVELSDNALNFAANPDTWVGVQVSGDPSELPRQHLDAAPYAITAATAATAAMSTVSAMSSTTQALQGVAVASAAPSDGNLLRYDAGATQWTPWAPSFVDLSSNQNIMGAKTFASNLGVGTTTALARVHSVAPGAFPTENSDGTVPATNVPLLAQSDSTAIGVLNSNGRPAFALNIEGNAGTIAARGSVVLYDKADGSWHSDVGMHAGTVTLNSPNPINFTSSWQGTPDPTTNVAEISNDTGTYKMLMVVGNKSGGTGLRRVGIWDSLYVAGTLIAGSSRELKQNIRPLAARDAIATFNALKPTAFAYKSSPDEPQMGFIAEEVPAVVATKDRKGVYTMNIVALLTKVVQGQQEQLRDQAATVQAQREHLTRLQQENASLMERLAKLESSVSRLSARGSDLRR
jgi:hypothetical protein